MSPLSATASRPMPAATAPKMTPVEADGDHDGTRAAPVAPKPSAAALATTPA